MFTFLGPPVLGHVCSWLRSADSSSLHLYVGSVYRVVTVVLCLLSWQQSSSDVGVQLAMLYIGNSGDMDDAEYYIEHDVCFSSA